MNDQPGVTSEEERRLAEWLAAGTPEPPRMLTAEDIAARTSASRPRHRWVPLLAAAAVLVIIVGVTIGLVRAGQSSAPATRPPSAPASASSPSPSPPRTASPRALPAHPWHAQQLGTLRLNPDSTTALDGRLYGEANHGSSTTLYRLDPATGRPLAHADHVGGLHPVAAAGRVWIPSSDKKAVLGLDPMTLAVTTTVRVPVNTGIATQGPDTVVVSADHEVSFIHSGRVTHQLTIAHRITSIAMSADGSRLYVATRTGGLPGPGQLETLDPQTGSAVGAPVRTGEVDLGIQATAGGIWSTDAGGMQAVIAFTPYQGHQSPIYQGGVGSSGGGALTFPSVSDGVAWLGSTGQLGCANPDTGTLRARVPVGTRNGVVIAGISGLVVLHGKVYAVYQGINGGPSNALIVMTPPAKCFGN